MHSIRRLRLIREVLSPIKQIRQIHLSSMSSKPVRALIMGPPGSGKGTVSERIVNTFKVTHLSSGDVLRSQIKEGTEVGLKAKAIVEKGGLVPDDIMVELILNKMKELSGGSWLLDGTCRFIMFMPYFLMFCNAAETLFTNVLYKSGRSLFKIIY